MNTELRDERKRRCLTLRQVAKAVGTDPGNLSRVENGQWPSRELAKRLHEFYGGVVSMLAILQMDDAA